eukprot:1494767-Pleurochrysis_carterae.AAC.1
MQRPAAGVRSERPISTVRATTPAPHAALASSAGPVGILSVAIRDLGLRFIRNGLDGKDELRASIGLSGGVHKSGACCVIAEDRSDIAFDMMLAIERHHSCKRSIGGTKIGRKQELACSQYQDFERTFVGPCFR